jgi:hypothetical protein
MLIAANPKIDMGKVGRIVGIINRNLEKNLKAKDLENAGRNISTLSHLIESPYAPRILANSTQVFEHLISLKSLQNEELEQKIRSFNQKLTKNKAITQAMITTNPSYIQDIIATSLEKTNLPIITNLFAQSVKKLLEANIVNETHLQYITERFSEESAICNKIKEVLGEEIIENMEDMDEEVRFFINLGEKRQCIVQ